MHSAKVALSGLVVVASLVALPVARCVACPPPDFNNSGQIDGADLGMLLAAWNTPGCDLNGDITTDGADLGMLLAAWGPCPPQAPLTCASPLTRALDENGLYVVEDMMLGDLPPVTVDAEAFGGAYTVTQSPPAGEVLSGGSDLLVTITVQGINGLVQSCVMPLTLEDVTPPVVGIIGVKDGQEILAPLGAEAFASALDNVTPNEQLLIEMTLDGDPYSPGNAIHEVGYHSIAISATDAAGNVGEETVTFLIRSRPVLQAVAAIESLMCSDPFGEDGYATLDVVVLLASTDFAVKDLDIAKVALWPLDELGRPLNKRVMFVAGSSDPAGFYSYATAEAEYQQGYWRLHFRTNAPDELVTGCPSGFLLTGVGKHGDQNVWDLDRFLAAAEDPDALGTLARSGGLNADPPADPPRGDPCPPCEWKEKWDPSPDACTDERSQQCNVGKDWYRINAEGDGAYLREGGESANNCFNVDWGTSCTASGSATLLVWLEGREICCQPQISVTLQPTIDVTCKVRPTSTATITPTIDEKSDCGNAAAKATGTLTRNVDGSVSATYAQSDIKSCPASMATVAVSTTVAVDVKAKKTHEVATALAEARVKRARARITVSAICSDCANSPFTAKQGF